MRLLLQRVTKASVRVNEKIVGAIDKGALIFIGIKNTDTKVQADALIAKIKSLHMMPDADGQTKYTLEDANASILLVSQFTLYADCMRGSRPSYSDAMAGAQAQELYDYMVVSLGKIFPGKVKTGGFAAYMHVELENDGPYTLFLEKEA